VTRILGIDPGSLVTGWGVVEAGPGGVAFVACGTVRTDPAADLAARLKRIHDEVRSLCAEFRPHEVAVERVFVDKNAGSALKLGQARAAAICGTFDGGAAVHEYAPREIKQAVTGTGAASKEQVAHMVRALLGLQVKVALDASDALACALTHAHGRGLAARLKASAFKGLPAGAKVGAARRRVRPGTRTPSKGRS
jgi:crossover junction endodeoxyribonuclease RuvC